MRSARFFVLSTTVSLLCACNPDDPSPGGDSGTDGTDTWSDTESDSYNSDSLTGGTDESSDEGGSDDSSGEKEVVVCPGPDDYEPNNDFMQAAPLVLDEGLLKARAGVKEGDPDLFVVDAPRADPITVEASYTAAVGDFTDLSMFVYTTAGLELARHQEQRKELSETMRVNFQAQGPATPYYIRVESNSPVCMPYVLDVSARTCTDEYEDNDTPKTATLLPIDPSIPTQLPGDPQVIKNDDDYYEVQTAGTDPMIIKAVYTPPSGDMTDLSMHVTDAVGAEIGKHVEKRTEPTENMRVRFMPNGANSVYRIRLSSNSDRCMPYSLEITPRACSDAFEDNESFETAKLLPEAQQNATVTDVDQDYFRIEALGPTGTCIVSYTVDDESPEDLSIFLYSTTHSLIGSHEEERSGAMENMVVHWNAGNNPAFLRVVAATGSCTPYRLECKAD